MSDMQILALVINFVNITSRVSTCSPPPPAQHAALPLILGPSSSRLPGSNGRSRLLFPGDLAHFRRGVVYHRKLVTTVGGGNLAFNHSRHVVSAIMERRIVDGGEKTTRAWASKMAGKFTAWESDKCQNVFLT